VVRKSGALSIPCSVGSEKGAAGRPAQIGWAVVAGAGSLAVATAAAAMVGTLPGASAAQRAPGDTVRTRIKATHMKRIRIDYSPFSMRT
jgi:hypothetical protein